MATKTVPQLTSYTTSCKDCRFAQLDGGGQIGCHMRDMPADSFFEEAADLKIHRVFKRLCQFKRELEPGGKWDIPLEEAKVKVREEVQIRYNIALDVYDVWGAQDSLRTIESQGILPDKVILVDRRGMGEPLFNLMNKSPLNCSLMEIFGDMPDWRDHVIQQHPARHLYCFSKTPLILPTQFFKKLDRRINDEEFRFGCIEDYDSEFLIISNFVYRTIQAPIRDIVENIERWAPRANISSV